jgi:hypothetical protein
MCTVHEESHIHKLKLAQKQVAATLRLNQVLYRQHIECYIHNNLLRPATTAIQQQLSLLGVYDQLSNPHSTSHMNIPVKTGESSLWWQTTCTDYALHVRQG